MEWPKEHTYNENQYCGLCDDFNTCRHNELLKQCSAAIAGISEEEIEKSIDHIPSTHVPISLINGRAYYYMSKEEIAFTIRSFLLKKVGR